MLEAVVELKNDPNNKALQAQKTKKKKNTTKNKAFISRASNEQNHKNYKEFVKQKQDEYIIKNQKRALPPIAPKNLKEIDANDKKSEEVVNDIPPPQTVQSITADIKQAVVIKKSTKTKGKTNSRRFELAGTGNCNFMKLKAQMKQLRKLKKIKLNDLSKPVKKKYYSDASFDIALPGQL